jgi:ribosomal-protein-alanine N-acetyltransferase
VYICGLMKMISETKRLRLRELGASDAAFIVQLVNTEGWLRFIGNRNIHSLDDARNYMLTGPLSSYVRNGFGLYLVETRDQEVPLGLCGLIKRESLDHPDLGFAFLPQHTGHGYAYEACESVLDLARNKIEISPLLAITTFDNEKSIGLLKKLGFVFKGPFHNKESNQELLLFENHLAQ